MKQKCNEKAMTFLMTHEFDLLWNFHGVQEKAMKYIQIFHGVQIQLNSWVMIIPLTGNF